ncbi:NAD(P)/FAD-dependent oxidoreductase [Pontibacter qinzhouensis]|uniref:NAD(P)/FAD-dependent oxidoreductase n=1 Tax=Pontibacter qinzhouensis TaxID=2603253 RepID=A0A5C8IJH9_9BACT|nr:NAD(P)/FAD-dependent oxidoreductase [Pontibacter qinzhouensis]TXK21380.1 NAD(P)/FAD-dependent oxidoreductase [Pontibacter qinzhouensis]
MEIPYKFDVIIIGGSFAGLSAAMSLGRALRKVLVLDGGKPCNRQAPHSHNFITHDGKPPHQIAQLARAQVEQYSSVHFYEGVAASGAKTTAGFEIKTAAGDEFLTRKLIFASGLKDLMPDIQGFAACWGTSVIHCPYCHGYEVRSQPTAILGNGDTAYHYAQLLFNWTKDLTILTNGAPDFTEAQTEKFRKNNIRVIEKEIAYLQEEQGQLQQVAFKDASGFAVKVMYARPAFEQNSNIPAALGCELTQQGLLKVSELQETTTGGVYACGDASNMRAVSVAVASGTMAGAAASNAFTLEEF